MSLLYRKYRDSSIHPQKGVDEKTNGVLTVSKDDQEHLKFPKWAPAWDSKDNHGFQNPRPFKFIDRGFYGDPSFESLRSIEGVVFKKISPNLGLEVNGIQLSSLSDKQKDDLALLVEQRGVVAFRNQDFKHQSFEEIKEWGSYFGPLHVHPTSGAPLDQPEFHLTFRRGSKKEHERFFNDRLNNVGWHTDVSYENQPPGITLFAMLQTGESGGDTQFIDTIEVYNRLSPLLKDKLDGLEVIHTSKDQAAAAREEGGIERKEPIDSIHPLVRYHPVLKKKSIFAHRGFSRRILGLKPEESDNLLLFLFKHTNSCLDAHVRLSWDENTVVIWDNRRVLHTRTLDWDSEDIRHAFRLTTLAERPVGSQKEYDNWSPELEEENLKVVDHYIKLTPQEYFDEVLSKKL